MTSFVFDIGEKARAISRFLGEVRAELQMALASEKKSRKLTQQQIAKMIGTDRSVINRQLIGYDNLTLRRVAELAWAMGWDIEFRLQKPQAMRTLKSDFTTFTKTSTTPPALSRPGTPNTTTNRIAA
jgi:hypothetical protein